MLLLANFLKSLLKRGGLYLDLNFFFFFLIQDDPEVKMLVLLGEVGGVEEYLICEALKNGRINKPMVAWCIGTCSDMFTTGTYLKLLVQISIAVQLLKSDHIAETK